MTKPELVQAWFENLWNRGVEATIDQILAPDIVAHGLGEQDLTGREAFRAFYRGFRAAFPTTAVTVNNILESGDHVVCQVEADCVAADGRGPFRLNGSCTIRVRDSQFAEAWNNFDFLSFLTSMGAVRPDAMAVALESAAGERS